MKNILFVFLFSILLVSTIKAQTIERVFTGNAGLTTATSSQSLSWSLGETFVGSAKSNEEYLTQGFQQPDLGIFTSIDFSEYVQEFILYPNPAVGIVNAKLTLNTKVESSITVINNLGEKLINYSVQNNSINQLDVSALEAGMYHIVLVIDHRIVRSQKLILIK